MSSTVFIRTYTPHRHVCPMHAVTTRSARTGHRNSTVRHFFLPTPSAITAMMTTAMAVIMIAGVFTLDHPLEIVLTEHRTQRSIPMPRKVITRVLRLLRGAHHSNHHRRVRGHENHFRITGFIIPSMPHKGELKTCYLSGLNRDLLADEFTQHVIRRIRLQRVQPVVQMCDEVRRDIENRLFHTPPRIPHYMSKLPALDHIDGFPLGRHTLFTQTAVRDVVIVPGRIWREKTPVRKQRGKRVLVLDAIKARIRVLCGHGSQ